MCDAQRYERTGARSPACANTTKQRKPRELLSGRARLWPHLGPASPELLSAAKRFENHSRNCANRIVVEKHLKIALIKSFPNYTVFQQQLFQCAAGNRCTDGEGNAQSIAATTRCRMGVFCSCCVSFYQTRDEVPQC